MTTSLPSHAPTDGPTDGPTGVPSDARPDAPASSARRLFLVASAAAGGGLMIAAHLPMFVPDAAAATPAAAPVFKPNAFVTIARDGKVTVTVPYTEMGQGTYTSIPMLVAEELEVRPETIAVVPAPPDEQVYGHPLYKLQVTGGSASVRAAWPQMRAAGATARVMLIQAAAQRWNVSPDTCRAENGQVIHVPTGRKLGYGALVDAAAKVPVPHDVALKPPSQYRVIGKSVHRLDARGKVDGSAKFGIDAVVPGMKVAAVAACPVFGGKLKSVDDSKALAVKGVRQVVRLDDAVAVVADHNGAAKKGLAALAIQWDEGPNAAFSNAAWASQLEQALKTKGQVAHNTGDFSKAVGLGARRVDAVYLAPPLAHTTMEPINCTVHVHDGRCEIWVGSQAPARAQQFAARATGLPVEKVTVNNFLIGGGFGRRLEADYVEQAAKIGMQVKHPVKVIWSREEDIQHDMYRPFFRDEMSAVLDKSGRVMALSHRFAGSAVITRYAPVWVKDIDGDAIEASETPYDIPTKYVEFVRAEPPAGLGTGNWRGVGPTHNVFVTEGFIDELANAAGQDPVAYRRAMLARQPRALAVLDLAAQKAGWGNKLPAGSGMGVCVADAWGSYAAAVVEVAVSKEGQLAVRRIVTAVDCGQAIHPDGVIAQTQSGLVYGLTAALYGKLTIENGRVMQSNFHDYQALRINEMPVMDVHLVASEATPGGMGELSTVVVAPALLNAVHAATGKRFRTYPLPPDALKTT